MFIGKVLGWLSDKCHSDNEQHRIASEIAWERKRVKRDWGKLDRSMCHQIRCARMRETRDSLAAKYGVGRDIIDVVMDDGFLG